MDNKVNDVDWIIIGNCGLYTEEGALYYLIEALVEAAKVYLKDVKVVDVSACHRPFSADDRPIIGKSATFLPTVTLSLPLEAAVV
mmetsp:Transcript_28153/g.47761  ORF Transcript_28153/g.47761 Transcript_28153/m.47761 type:complete len:85 (-) Transcript_28153:4371-4625(-)